MAVYDRAQETVDLLHAVADADDVDQERNDEAERIEAELEEHDDGEKPDDGRRRAQHRDGGEREGARVVPKGERVQEEGDGEEGDDVACLVADIADEFGEADDADRDLVVLELPADLALE